MNAPPALPDLKPAAPFFRPIAAGAVLLNLLVIGSTLLSLFESREQYHEQAAATARNLVQVLEQYIDGVVDKIDLALLAVADEAQRQPDAGNASVRQEFGDFIARQGGRLPDLDGLYVADAKGRIVARYGAEPPMPSGVAQHDYFIQLRAARSADIVFSRPLKTNGGDWVIVLARRIERPGGGFAGVVCASVAIARFHKMFSSLDIGKQGSIALRDDELSLIVRYPELRRDGETVGDRRVSVKLTDMIASGAAAGTYMTTTPFDNVERVLSYRRIAVHPLIVVVGIAKDDYLAPWRGEVVEHAVYALLFAVITLLWVALLHYVWMRKAFAARLEHDVLERTTELRALAVELTKVEERERNAIARDLHDDLGQTLAIAKLKLTALDAPNKSLAECPYHDCMLRQIKEVETMIDRSNRSVRSLSRQLSPSVLHQFGLVAALEWLADEMQDAYRMNVGLYDDGKPKPLDQASANMLFRAVRELLINVHKHAGTDKADVALSVNGGQLSISVTDDGGGFDARNKTAPTAGGGFGLFSVSERIRYFGGEMQIDSGCGYGTVVVLILPLATKSNEGENDTVDAGRRS